MFLTSSNLGDAGGAYYRGGKNIIEAFNELGGVASDSGFSFVSVQQS